MAITDTVRRIFYGGPSHGNGTKLSVRHLFLPVAVIPFVLGLIGLLLIELVVDPYAVRPWGLTPRLGDHRYPDLEWPLLLKVVTRQDHQLVMIGASTMMGVSRSDLVKAFGAKTKPVNLAYPYAAPRDTRIVVDAVATMPSVRRVIFIMDHSQMMGLNEKRLPAQLRERVFASDWAHAGDFRWDTLLASWNRLTRGVYDRPTWQHLQDPEFFAGFSPVTDQPRTLQRMAGAVVRHRGDVFGRGIDRNCGQYPFFNTTLVPALEKFRARGIQVDLVFPPYPYAGYYDWIDHRTTNDPFYPGPVYPQLMGFKRCVLGIAARFAPGVTVHAFDNDASITGYVGNYNDNVHLIRSAMFKVVLEHIAHRDSVLTESNFDQYDRELRQHILNYHM